MSLEALAAKYGREELEKAKAAREAGEEPVDEPVDELVAQLKKKQRDLIREWHVCEEQGAWGEADRLLARATRIQNVIRTMLES